MDRSQIDSKYKWDLNSIYSSEEEIQKDIQETDNLVEKIATFKGHVLENADNLLQILELESKRSLIINRLYVYFNLNYCLDTRESTWNKKIQDLMDLYSKQETKITFVSIELKSLTYEQLEKFIQEKPEFKKHENGLKEIIKHQEHILSEEEEVLISTLEPVLDGYADVFDKLDNADIILGDVVDSNGTVHKMTQGSYREYMGSSDRVLRKNAFLKMHEYYKNHKNSIAECLSGQIKTNSIFCKVRKYNSALEAALSDNNLKPEFYTNFINAVHNHLGTLDRMMELYRKALNVEEMHIYDINARIGKFDRSFKIEDITNTVRDSLKIMGDDYLQIVDEAFTNNWVDYYETPGKTSGAFSSGSYDTKPYILLNYTGGFDDVETLAHELGHSIHSHFSNKYCEYENSSYPIFLAEIASTTHEVLLNNYLLSHAKNKEEKLYILNNILSNFKSTVFRQTEFAEFELNAYNRVENGENLSCDDITSMYYDLQKTYYRNVVQDEDIKYEVLRIPHFYTSFYVYQYAVGLTCAYKFAKRIIDNEPNAKENYIKFISNGSKNYPLDILKECGIDLNNLNILDDAIKLIEDYLDEFEQLLEEE